MPNSHAVTLSTLSQCEKSRKLDSPRSSSWCLGIKSIGRVACRIILRLGDSTPKISSFQK